MNKIIQPSKKGLPPIRQVAFCSENAYFQISFMRFSDIKAGKDMDLIMSIMLWFQDEEHQTNPFIEGTMENLDILSLTSIMFGGSKLQMTPEELCKLFSTEKSVIEKRQEVLRELMDRPPLLELFNRILDKIYDLEEFFALPDYEDDTTDLNPFDALEFYNTVLKYIGLINDMDTQLSDGESAQSEGVNLLMKKVGEVHSGFEFTRLVSQWDRRMLGLSDAKSVSIAFQMDEYFNFTGVKLTEVSNKRFIRENRERADCKHALTDPMGLNEDNILTRISSFKNRYKTIDYNYTVSDESNIDLNKTVMNLTAHCVGDSYRRVRDYLKQNTKWIIDIKIDLLFYTGVLRLMEQLQSKNADYCFPIVGDFSEKRFIAKELYNPMLLFYGKTRVEVVDNDVCLAAGGEFTILTGANQGGKTTFLRSIGLAQFMMQLGLPVAAAKMEADLVDNIYTVFSIKEEDLNSRQGKLGQELAHIANISRQMTANNMILFNEPISGTSTAETLIISREVLCAIKLVGARGVWVTHLHDLAADIKHLNSIIGGITLKNMIAVVNHNASFTTPTYHVIEADPEMTSYANDVVRRYGLKLE